MSHSPYPTFDIEVQDHEYLRHDGVPLLARLYLPQGPGPFPMVAEVHGGAWCRGTRLDEAAFNESLARRGVAVAAIDFRMPPVAGYPASLADINFVLRWLKSRAAQWRTRPEHIGVMGLSSGAHQAVLAALRPHDRRYGALPLPAGEQGHVDATAAFVVACWPVIDPLGRYRYAQAMQARGRPYPEAIDRVIPDHRTYWGSEEAMADGDPVPTLERGELRTLPPMLCLQGEDDIVHPREQLERFIAAYHRAGGTLELRLFAGEAEGFINKKPDAPATRQAREDIVRFVHACCGLAAARHGVAHA